MELKRRIVSNRVSCQFRRCVRDLSKVGLRLHDWQIDGVKWMLNREQDYRFRGGFLLDDMGLGKTLETIGVMIGNKVEKTLLVLPTSLISQWRCHLEKYDPDLKIVMHYGSDRLTSSWELESEGRLIVITSYEMTYSRQSIHFCPTILHKICWDRIICDECHLIRNAKCKRTQGIWRLNGGIRWGLTGTPIHNGEIDFVNLFRFHDYSINYISKNLLSLIERYTLRRTKKMIGGDLDLPGLEVHIHKLDFSSEEEREFYRRVRGEVREEFSRLRNMRFNMTAVFELLLRSRQSCIYPGMVINGYNKKYHTSVDNWRGSVSKIQKIVDMIHNNYQKDFGSDKSLVFTHFKEEMNLLKNYLSRLGFNVSTIDGSVSLSSREDILDLCHFNILTESRKCVSKLNIFSDDIMKRIMSYHSPVDILIVQINTGSTGLNLQMFNHVYFSSPCWNPAIEDQAICRSYRLGQTKKVTVHKMVMHDSQEENDCTIEEKILSIQEKKRKIMSSVLNDPDLLNNGKISNCEFGKQSYLSLEDYVYMLG